MMKDPYQILGVSKTATQDEIKSAYRNLAKKLHPDLNPGNKAVEEKFKDISLAYERIGTAEARAKFDRGETPEQQQEQAQEQARRYAEAQARASQGGRGPFYHDTQQDGGRYSYSFGGDMGGDDFFENLFKAAGQTGRTRGAHGSRDYYNKGQRQEGMTDDFPGQDRLYQMSVDFKDAVLGTEREITLPNGKRLHVKIPAGVETGTKLRFKNQGDPGIGNGPPGDAYVEITVRPLQGFKRTGFDIETEVAVSFIEAILGAEIKVPTLEGHVMLKVPPGVSTGSRLRIKGKGVASIKEKGDQIVSIKIVMPKKNDPSLESAIKELSQKYSYNPREEV